MDVPPGKKHKKAVYKLVLAYRIRIEQNVADMKVLYYWVSSRGK